MNYIDTTLQPGETVRLRGKRNPAVLFGPGLFTLVFIVSIHLIFLYIGMPLFVWLLLILPAAYFLERLFSFLGSESAVTDQRILVKTGLLSRRISELSLSKLESIVIDQSFFGRLFNFADLRINGTGGHCLTLPALTSPLSFRSTLQQSITA